MWLPGYKGKDVRTSFRSSNDRSLNLFNRIGQDSLAVFIFRLYTPTVIGRAIKITPDRGDRARTDDGYILRYSRQVICVVSVPFQSGPG